MNESWDVGHDLRVTLLEQKPFVEYRLKILTVTNVSHHMMHHVTGLQTGSHAYIGTGPHAYIGTWVWSIQVPILT